MEAASEGENNRNSSDSPMEGQKRPKRQMKTPYQLEILEKSYASERYPSEATRAELSEKLGLSDRQLQMWFCHRRLKDKKDMGVKKPLAAGAVGKKGLLDPARDELMFDERESDHGSSSASGSGSRSTHFDYGDEVTMATIYYESPVSVMERRVIACVEAQLGEPLREDGPILGMEFDELPPGEFGAPLVMTKQPNDSGLFCDGKSFEQCDFKPIKAGIRGHRECLLDECLVDESSFSSDAYGRLISNFNDLPVECPSANASLPMHGNEQFSMGYGVQGSLSSQQGRPGRSSPAGDNNCISQRESLINMQMDAPDSVHPAIGSENTDASDRFISNSEYGLQLEKKRKSNEARIGTQVETYGITIQKELEKQDILRHKREEQMKREMEKQDRERQKEEERMMREKQRQQERFQREEKRENERREKFLLKESLKAERRRQKEELRREKEEAKLKAALARATARKIARESMELIEDERLELMELAASSKGLPSIISLDHDTLQNLESFRGFLCSFPPKCVQLKRPFSVQPWTGSDENIGDLLMVWRFCITFADVLGLWPFTLVEFVQAFHDYDSRLLGEIHIALLKLIVKDIEDVARTPSIGIGTNQCSSANPVGGHPQIVEGAYLWGFDICSWKNYLNPLTWPEILRQFALSAGFGPRLKEKSIERTRLPDNAETKGCEDIISILRSSSAAENAVAIMQEKGFPLQRKSRHRLTPGTVKFAAYHVLSLEGSKGMTVLELAHKIQQSGLRDLTTSKTPEASISVALSRDAVLFERTAPSTYCVRTPFRKDPADAEAILSAAREKIKRYVNGFVAGENADDVERDEDSEGEGAEVPEVLDLGPPNANKHSNNGIEINTYSGNGKENFLDDDTSNLQNEHDTSGTIVNQFVDVSNKDDVACNPYQGDTEIDESKSGEPWVQGLSEGEYSDLSVEERLNALVALVGIANEGNSIRAALEGRLGAANALKKQMLAEAQLDEKRIKEESVHKFHCASFAGHEAEVKQTFAVAESSQGPLVSVDNKIRELPLDSAAKEEPFIGTDNVQDSLDSLPADRILVEPESSSMGSMISSIQQNAERYCLQLKSYIAHRAEETYIYRSLPLGQDRRRNRYWQFAASASRHDPGSGRIFVESPEGCWRHIDSEEAFDVLVASLDTRGIRESHLQVMLQDIEKPFKENVRRNSQCASNMDRSRDVGNEEDAVVDCSPAQSGDADSRRSTAVSGSNPNTCEPSFSFKIELGRNETEKKVAMERYQEFQMWMWKECFNSSTLCAMSYGEKRCRPLLGICDFCLDSYVVEKDLCSFCHKPFGTVDNKITLSEQHEDERKVSPQNANVSKSSHPLRIRLLRALLTLIEVSVPSKGLPSSWIENCRKSWGTKLIASSSAGDLLQILTEFEAVIKRGCLSANFETTEELLSASALSGRGVCDYDNPGFIPQLPWIPQTTAAVAVRLLELDASISYTLQQKFDNLDDNEKPPSRYAFMKNIKDDKQKPEVNQDKHWKEKNITDLTSVHGSNGFRQAICGPGIRGSFQKRVGSSRKRNLRDAKTLTQVLGQQGQRTTTHGQRLGRGRRTVRKRRTEKRAVRETLLNHLDDMGGLKNFRASPRNPSGDEVFGKESEDDGCDIGYKYGKCANRNSMVMSDDDDNIDGHDDEFAAMGEENIEGNVNMNVDSDGRDSDDSEDYSD